MENYITCSGSIDNMLCGFDCLLHIKRANKKVVGPVEGLAKVTNTFLIVVLVLGSMILILLSTLAIRERKYEIGVLRAMGMKKAKVALGLLTEMLVITVICLILGLGIGMVASQPVADSLLASQIELAEENSNTNVGMQTGGGTGTDAIT
jgi:putative ABC transport system permease protein